MEGFNERQRADPLPSEEKINCRRWLFAGEKAEGFTLLGGDQFQMRVNPEEGKEWQVLSLSPSLSISLSLCFYLSLYPVLSISLSLSLLLSLSLSLSPSLSVRD